MRIAYSTAVRDFCFYFKFTEDEVYIHLDRMDSEPVLRIKNGNIIIDGEGDTRDSERRKNSF